MIPTGYDAQTASTTCDSVTDLKASIRASLCYFQTVRHKVKSIIAGRPKRKTAK